MEINTRVYGLGWAEVVERRSEATLGYFGLTEIPGDGPAAGLCWARARVRSVTRSMAGGYSVGLVGGFEAWYPEPNIRNVTWDESVVPPEIG